jgi:hypothetical protein
VTEQTSLATLQGQIDAVTHLCATLAANATPLASHLLITQAEKAIQHAHKNGQSGLYLDGYIAAAQHILSAIREATEAQETLNTKRDA